MSAKSKSTTLRESAATLGERIHSVGGLPAMRAALEQQALTIASQRATIAKLRKKLTEVETMRDANWDNSERYKRGWDEANRTCEIIERLYNTLANSIGRKA